MTLLNESNNKIALSEHAIKRIKQRLGIKRRAAKKTAQRAFDRGITLHNAKGELKWYLKKIYLNYGKADNIRVYGMHVFLFAEATLITVYHLPRNLYMKALKT